MTKLNQDLRVILIGGSSHAGKSTLAQALANRLGWQYICTDTLARHPGRPWQAKPQTVPAHVAEHYLSLPVEELLADVLRHYKNLWPRIEALITTHATDPSTERLVLEGSALWPESVATLDVEGVTAVFLTTSNTFFQTRIYNESSYAEATKQGQAMIEKFLARTQLYNKRMMTAVTHLNLPYLNIEQSLSIEKLLFTCLELFTSDDSD